MLVVCGLSGCSTNKSTQKAVHRETIDSFVRIQSDSLCLREKKWTAVKGMEQSKSITLSAPDDSGRQYVQSMAWREQHWQQADSCQSEKIRMGTDTIRQVHLSYEHDKEKKQKKPGRDGLWRNMGILAICLLIGYCLHSFTRKS